MAREVASTHSVCEMTKEHNTPLLHCRSLGRCVTPYKLLLLQEENRISESNASTTNRTVT